MKEPLYTGYRAKLAEAIREAQKEVREKLVPPSTNQSNRTESSSRLKHEIRQRAHLSALNYDSFETIDLEKSKPVEREALIGREWIEDHIDYTRRYRLTDKEIQDRISYYKVNLNAFGIRNFIKCNLNNSILIDFSNFFSNFNIETICASFLRNKF